MLIHRILAAGALASLFALHPLASLAASQAPVAGEHGMVVTAQHLATHVGVDVLKRGGNAVDAAVAVGYARWRWSTRPRATSAAAAS